MTALDIVDIEHVPVVPRDGWDRPLVVPKTGGKPVPYQRTTTFIDVIEDKSNIADWRIRSVLEGILADPSLFADFSKIDPEAEDYKAQVKDFAERAMDAAGANRKRDKGTDLHVLSEYVDQGLALPVDADDEDKLKMADYALLTSGLKHSHVEKFVVVPEFQVGGTPDRISQIVPELFPSLELPEGVSLTDNLITDLKTGSVDYGGLKMSAQLACYSRAEFYDFTRFPAPRRAKQVTKKADPEGFEAHKAWQAWTKTEFSAEDAALAYSPIPPVNQDWGIIFHLPSFGEGTPALYWVDLKIGHQAALLAQQIHAVRKLNKQALRPIVSG